MLTRPRLWKPRHEETSLDRNHPLARGLRLAYLFNEGGGSTVYNRARPRNHFAKSASPTWAAGKYGSHLTTASEVQMGSVAGDPDWQVTGAITVIWLGALHPTVADFGYLFTSEGSGVASGWGVYTD